MVATSRNRPPQSLLVLGADRPTRDAVLRAVNGSEIVSARSIADVLARLRASKRFRALVVGPKVKDARRVIEQVRGRNADILVLVVADPAQMSSLRQQMSRGPGLDGVKVVSAKTRVATIAEALGPGTAAPAPIRGRTKDPRAAVAKEQSALEASESSRTQLIFLAEASAALSASLDYEKILQTVARLAVPALADWCQVDLLDESGAIQRIAVAHADPAQERLVREMARRYPTPPDAPHGAPSVIRTGVSEIVSEIPIGAVERSAYNRTHLKLLQKLQLRSVMSIPLIARGRTLGAITFMAGTSGRRFTGEDLAFAEQLTSRAALAVDNARLLRDAQLAEQELSALVNGLDAIVWEADVETGRITFINQRVAELTGYSIDHWTDQPHSWWDLIDPADRDAVRAARQEAMATEPSHDVEYRIVVASGPQRWVRDAAHIIADPAGGPLRVRGVVVDITARKVAEIRQRAQHAVTRVLAEASTLADAAPRLLQAVCDALGWELGAIWQVDERARVIRCLEVWSPREVNASEFMRVTKEAVFPPRVGLPGRVWRTSAPAWIQDIVVDDNFPRAPTAAVEGLHAAFGFPIVQRGRTLGVMEFFSKEIRQPDEDLLRMLGAIGAQVGQFIERRLAEEALAESETQLRFQNALLESESEATLDGILVVSPDGTVLSSNRRFAEMWRIPDDLIAAGRDQALIEYVLDQLVDPQEFSARIQYLYDHPHERSRDEIALSDGRIIDRWSTPLEGPDGARYGRAWYFRDITDQKRTEQRLSDNQERFAFLAEASGVLSGSLEHERSLEALARFVVPYLADWCVIDVLELDGGVRRVAVAHVDPDKAALARRLDLNRHYLIDPDAEHGLSKVLRTGRPEFAPTIPENWLEAVSETPEYLDTLRQMGFHAYICVPLLARGRILGAITLVTAESRRTYTQDDFGLAEELARRAALAIDNARLYRDRADVARTLQESLLPPRLPEIPGVDVAARYLAAVERNEVGGDFYDLFKTRKNSWAVVIGDVCGKGAEAATITALARYTVRTIAMQMRKPSRILENLNEALLSQRSDARFCTVAYGRLDVGGPIVRIDVACGGHPPPLILRADGSVEQGGRPGTLLGMFPDPELHEMSVELRSSDAIVFYTDGITEARGDQEHFGEARLEGLLRSCAGMDAAHIAERLERTALEFQQSRPRDDIALLVLRVP